MSNTYKSSYIPSLGQKRASQNEDIPIDFPTERTSQMFDEEKMMDPQNKQNEIQDDPQNLPSPPVLEKVRSVADSYKEKLRLILEKKASKEEEYEWDYYGEEKNKKSEKIAIGLQQIKSDSPNVQTETGLELQYKMSSIRSMSTKTKTLSQKGPNESTGMRSLLYKVDKKKGETPPSLGQDKQLLLEQRSPTEEEQLFYGIDEEERKQLAWALKESKALQRVNENHNEDDEEAKIATIPDEGTRRDIKGEDDYEFVQLDPLKQMILTDLLSMGFPRRMINQLLMSNPSIEDSNQAVELLIKGPNGYTHKYIPRHPMSGDALCKICGEERYEHQNEQDRRLQLFYLQEDIEAQRQQLELLVPLRVSLPQNKPEEKKPQAVPVEDGSGKLCDICYSNYAEKDFSGLDTCKHYFCLNCIMEYLEFNINNGQVTKVKCAQSTCTQEYTSKDIKKFGSKEIYEKYLKFKENIDVNTNPDLRWCPKPDCGNYVRKPKKGQKVDCECGYQICFKCGQQWHGRTKCDEHADKGYFAWASANSNIGNCPKCKARLQKIDGCNHMTCASCRYQWCWLCGRKYNSYHYNPINVFGCAGQQNFTYNRFFVVLLNIGLLIILPLILFFVPFGWIVAMSCDKSFSRYSGCCSCARDSCWRMMFAGFFILLGAIVVGAIAGAICLGLLIVPALLFQLYRLMKLIFYRCCCHK